MSPAGSEGRLSGVLGLGSSRPEAPWRGHAPGFRGLTPPSTPPRCPRLVDLPPRRPPACPPTDQGRFQGQTVGICARGVRASTRRPAVCAAETSPYAAVRLQLEFEVDQVGEFDFEAVGAAAVVAEVDLAQGLGRPTVARRKGARRMPRTGDVRGCHSSAGRGSGCRTTEIRRAEAGVSAGGPGLPDDVSAGRDGPVRPVVSRGRHPAGLWADGTAAGFGDGVRLLAGHRREDAALAPDRGPDRRALAAADRPGSSPGCSSGTTRPASASPHHDPGQIMIFYDIMHGVDDCAAVQHAGPRLAPERSECAIRHQGAPPEARAP
ncbi:hypothetical protein BX260_0025 [Streptomyces sp. 5112.2]|nr:hypothetical protein BX260_0025 [Streptomyces sp. 5112.2]